MQSQEAGEDSPGLQAGQGQEQLHQCWAGPTTAHVSNGHKLIHFDVIGNSPCNVKISLSLPNSFVELQGSGVVSQASMGKRPGDDH